MATIDELWTDIKARVNQSRPQVFAWQSTGSGGPGIHVELEDENTLRGREIDPPHRKILATKDDFAKVVPLWEKVCIGSAEVQDIELEEPTRGFVLGALDWYAGLLAKEKERDTKKLRPLIKGERWLAEYHYRLEEERLSEVQRRAGTMVAAGGGFIAVAVGLFVAGGGVNTVLRSGGVIPLIGCAAAVLCIVSVGFSLVLALKAIRGRKYWHPMDSERLVERLWPLVNPDTPELDIDRTIAQNLSRLAKKNREQTELRFAKVTRAVDWLVAGTFMVFVFFICWLIAIAN